MIAIYRYFVSLKPRNQQGEMKELRDQVMDAGQPNSVMKALTNLQHLCELLRTWDRKRIQYEVMSGGPASDDPHYKARLRDVLLRVLGPVLSKMGSLGGTLGMALESRKTMKRIQTGDTHAELTW